MENGFEIIEKFKVEIAELKLDMLDSDLVTPKNAQERFDSLYKKHHAPLPPGEPYANLFEKELVELFQFIKENRTDIFKSHGGSIVWIIFKKTAE